MNGVETWKQEGPDVRETVVSVAMLKAQIRVLITIDESEAPFLSCYLSCNDGVSDYRRVFDERIRVLRRSLMHQEQAPFEEALEKIEGFLSSQVLPTTEGIAIFARGGG